MQKARHRTGHRDMLRLLHTIRCRMLLASQEMDRKEALR